MSIDAALYDALRGLVDDRVYPVIFPQPPSVPVWPSIRYTFVARTPVAMLCPSDSVEEDDFARVQLDLVAKHASEARLLRKTVMDTMKAFDPPATIESSFETYDMETATFRIVVDMTIHSSTV